MTTITEILTDKADISRTKTVTREAPALQPGEVLLEIDSFGLTSNNVSYAVTGNQIGYWSYFPVTQEPDGTWGKVPVWGFASVVESASEEIAAGERLWGFWPMASHVVIQPGQITARRIIDIAPHRAELPPLYNAYTRTGVEPDAVRPLDNLRCILFPLFATSYILYDYLIDNAFFGADQVLIGSASSKTGFGLAHLLHNDPGVSAKVIGLTSPSRIGFCEQLGCYDQAIAYDDLTSLDASVPSAFIDMSGNMPLTIALHEHFGENIRCSSKVGATHFQAMGKVPEGLPGARPRFFFAPAQFAKRDQDWGEGVIWQKTMEATLEMMPALGKALKMETMTDPDAVRARWDDLLNNRISGDAGLLGRLS